VSYSAVDDFDVYHFVQSLRMSVSLSGGRNALCDFRSRSVAITSLPSGKPTCPQEPALRPPAPPAGAGVRYAPLRDGNLLENYNMHALEACHMVDEGL
jgi:hypothetical protein